MRAALFLSVTYTVDGFSKKERGETGWFYFSLFIVFLIMDIAEIAKG